MGFAIVANYWKPIGAMVFRNSIKIIESIAFAGLRAFSEQVVFMKSDYILFPQI